MSCGGCHCHGRYRVSGLARQPASAEKRIVRILVKHSPVLDTGVGVGRFDMVVVPVVVRTVECSGLAMELESISGYSEGRRSTMTKWMVRVQDCDEKNNSCLRTGSMCVQHGIHEAQNSIIDRTPPGTVIKRVLG